MPGSPQHKKSSQSKKSSSPKKNNRRNIHQDYTSIQPYSTIEERADAETRHNALSSKLRELTDEHNEALKLKHKKDENVEEIRKNQEKVKKELRDLEARQKNQCKRVGA